ncbi:MAG: complement resistance protein TraT [Verrucomicrobiaceae bacterium]|nr:complement resistance protein TraT [Verrucomicrobiaceae bacterium]
MKNPARTLLIALGIMMTVVSCARPGPNRRTGVAVGSASGAVAGAIIGANNGRPLVGAAIGSVAGAIVGGAIGSAQDRAMYDAGYGPPPPPRYGPYRYYYGRPYPYRRW